MGAGMGGWNEKVSSEKYFAPDTKTYYVIYTCFERCNNHKKLLKKTKGMTPQKEAPPNEPTERKKPTSEPSCPGQGCVLHYTWQRDQSGKLWDEQASKN